jgi:pteridine reductase
VPPPSFDSLFGTDRPVALVTGAGAPRVGNVVARTLAARGYWLAIHANRSLDAARQTAAELKSGGIEAVACCAEITDETAVRSLVSEVRQQFGRIDVLVNCAAIWSPKPLEEVSADDVRRYLEVNTLGTFLFCQQVGLLMVQQPTGGAIVNMGDWAPVRPYLDYAAYFPSKGAIPTLTRDFAVELGTRNPRVRVNAILPGPVMIPKDLPEEERQLAVEGTLVKREGSPQNVADAVVSLVENDFITGVCLPVDGGRSIYAPSSERPQS